MVLVIPKVDYFCLNFSAQVELVLLLAARKHLKVLKVMDTVINNLLTFYLKISIRRNGCMKQRTKASESNEIVNYVVLSK